MERSLCDDEDNVVIEGCIASEFKVTVEGIDNLSGTRIKVIQRINDYEMKLFSGKIDSCPLQADRQSRTITAYDDFYNCANINVAGWYNEFSFPADIEDFLRSLLDYVGIPCADSLEVRQSFSVYKTLDTISMDFDSVIKAVCNIIGGFGVINPEGEFDIVYLSNEISSPNLTAMSGFELEQYEVKAIDKVVIRSEETDIGGSCGEGHNTYIIQGNFLCFGMEAEELENVAVRLYQNVAGFSWRPCIFELGISNPLIGCDGLRYRVTTSQGDDFETYILNSYLSGVQLLSQEIESYGSEYRNEVVENDYTDALISAYKVMKLKATVEGFDLEIKNKVGSEELITKINASAEKILISSSKIDVAGLVKFINEDKSESTEINGGKIIANSIKAASIDIDDVFAQNIEATGTIKGLTLESLNASIEKGYIGGFEITKDSLQYEDFISTLGFTYDKVYYHPFGIAPNSDKVIYIGGKPGKVTGGTYDNETKKYWANPDNMEYPFYVRNDGYAFLSSGKIGGFDIDDTGLSAVANVWVYPTADDFYLIREQIQTSEDLLTDNQKKAFDFFADGIIDPYDFAATRTLLLGTKDLNYFIDEKGYTPIYSDILIKLDLNDADKVLSMSGTSSFESAVDYYFGVNKARLPKTTIAGVLNTDYEINSKGDVIANYGEDSQVSLTDIATKMKDVGKNLNTNTVLTTSVPARKNTAIATFTVSKSGIYMLNFGFRSLVSAGNSLSIYSTSEASLVYQASVYPGSVSMYGSAFKTCMNGMRIVTLTAGTTYYVYAYSTVAVNIDDANWFYAFLLNEI